VSVLVAAALAAPGGAGAASPPNQRPVVVRVSDGGFHWGDAAIGAAGAIGLILVVTALRLAWGTARVRARNIVDPDFGRAGD
jgi:hypothetical protein